MTAQRLHDIDGVDEIAQAVWKRAADDGFALTPKTFSIWHGYFSGFDPALSEAVEAALESENALSDATIDRLYRQFFTAEALEHGVSTISAKLEQELETLVGTVGRNVERTDDYVGKVSSISQRIEKTDGGQVIQPFVRQLIEASRFYVDEKRSLLDELKVVRDQVDEMRLELNALQREAYVDHLTQISNRRRFDTALDEAIAAARAADEPLCVALADIDRFKGVNDAWGHAVGDKILKRFADLMKKNVRSGDVVARFGGEEFALIMPNTPLDVSAKVADRIREYLSSTRFVARDSGQRLGRVTVSFGVTALREDDDAFSLVQRADVLLYGAKNAGRNQVRAEA